MRNKISKKEASLLEKLWLNNFNLKANFDHSISDIKEVFIEDIDKQYDKSLSKTRRRPRA